MVGNGRKVLFWKDRWCGDNLFVCYVGGWSPCFSRSFNDWDVDYVGRFLACLQGQRVRRDVEDTLFWSVTKSGKFIVKSFTIVGIGLGWVLSSGGHLDFLGST